MSLFNDEEYLQLKERTRENISRTAELQAQWKPLKPLDITEFSGLRQKLKFLRQSHHLDCVTKSVMVTLWDFHYSVSFEELIEFLYQSGVLISPELIRNALERLLQMEMIQEESGKYKFTAVGLEGSPQE